MIVVGWILTYRSCLFIYFLCMSKTPKLINLILQRLMYRWSTVLRCCSSHSRWSIEVRATRASETCIYIGRTIHCNGSEQKQKWHCLREEQHKDAWCQNSRKMWSLWRGCIGNLCMSFARCTHPSVHRNQLAFYSHQDTVCPSVQDQSHNRTSHMGIRYF